jgi:phosphatidate cytidylyltransferase
MVGSYFLSIISIYFLLNNFYINEIIKFSFSTIIFALLISSVSQLGDIIVSYFKRHSKIKDTGKILPGHGGMLDRIDGMIFAFPFSYFIISSYFLK